MFPKTEWLKKNHMHPIRKKRFDDCCFSLLASLAVAVGLDYLRPCAQEYQFVLWEPYPVAAGRKPFRQIGAFRAVVLGRRKVSVPARLRKKA